jgi:hypothetical protein
MNDFINNIAPYNDKINLPIMKNTVLIAFVAILISLQPIYASFPVSKKKTEVSAEAKSTDKIIMQPVKISGISSNSIHFDDAILKDIIVPKQERFILTKTLLRNMVGAQSASSSKGWGVASFCCAMAGLIFAAVPMGILALIFGFIGLKEVKKGLAIAGIVIGAVDVILGLIIISSMA